MSKETSEHNQILCHGHEHGSSMTGELIEHFPYAVFSVALGLIGAALMQYFSFGATAYTVKNGSFILFHAFHYLHIVFAATGSMITFFRFSKNIIKGVVVATISTLFFCVLSDILLPYLAGYALGAHMNLHICFNELNNVLPFLVIGLFNGWVLNQHSKDSQTYYSVWSHFAHIFVSSIASLLYMISNGFDQWSQQMGPIFFMLILAVVIPCTFSDVVVPMFFAKRKKGHE